MKEKEEEIPAAPPAARVEKEENLDMTMDLPPPA